jgi:hypothetical protein
MGDDQDFRRPDREEYDFMDADVDDLLPSKQGLQGIAHDRGRICKKRGCVVCAPLVAQRRLKKKQRRADAQAALHAKGQPCGRSSCSLAVCAEARQAPVSSPAPVESRAGSRSTDESQDDPDRVLRRQDERHRVGLPCGSEDCSSQVCIDGFANARTRRHRARRPCRSATCDNAICVADRSTN